MPQDGINEQQRLLFSLLALETFFRGSGARMDVVSNLTCSDILQAGPTRVKCPFCQELVVYQEHQPLCRVRRVRLEEGAQDQTVCPPKHYSFKVKSHKTGNISDIGK